MRRNYRQRLPGITLRQCFADADDRRHSRRLNRPGLVLNQRVGLPKIGAAFLNRPDSWTGFGGWWPDGRAIVGSAWEDEKNYLWEREHKTFRHTQGWLIDGCLVELATGATLNPTAVERVSDYNSGLAPWPGDPTRATFSAIINGIQHPFVMDADGRNKRDLSSGQEGFTYAARVSPDGNLITYNKDYLLYVAEKDGSHPRRLDLTREHTFQFSPSWSPDGKWILFLSGQHYQCHPHLVRPDGTGLRKLADRGTYRSVMEPLKFPDFHSAHSDLPAWSADSQWVYYTAQIGEAVELLRVSLAGKIEQLTHSHAGVAHYHPMVSPDGKLIAFGSTRDGPGAQYVANADGTDIRAITPPTPGRVQLHSHWRPENPAVRVPTPAAALRDPAAP